MARISYSSLNKRGSIAVTNKGYGSILLLVVVVCALLAASAKAQQQIGGIPTISPEELQKLMTDAKAAGYILAGFLIDALSSYIPTQTTLMIPSDSAISSYLRGTDATSQLDLPRLLEYHVVTKLLPFEELSRFAEGERLPTFLPGYSLLVTDNTTHSFKIDNARVVKPNLCTTTTTLACHGVDSILNLKAYGRAAAVSPSVPPLVAPASSPGSSPALAPINSGPTPSPFIAVPPLAPLVTPTPASGAPPGVAPVLAPSVLSPPITSPGPQLPPPPEQASANAAFSLRREHASVQQMVFLVLVASFLLL